MTLQLYQVFNWNEFVLDPNGIWELIIFTHHQKKPGPLLGEALE